ncbi:hypothetical protein ACFYU9_11550 [Streptomyces sp. NPDC004327]|uniref:hypothetical protein n=1 Tax=Streptomyces sp. NPDC004327 TaxID=3364699 RepID=UPI0036C4AE02
MGTEGIENERVTGRRADAEGDTEGNAGGNAGGDALPAIPDGPGTPDGAAAPAASAPAVPGPRPTTSAPAVPGPRPTASAPAVPGPRPAASAPAVPGPRPAAPAPAVPGPRPADWWRADAMAAEATPTGQVPGFVGGVEIPEILKPPPSEDDEPEDPETGDPEFPDEPPRPLARLRALPRFGSPLLVIAAALLLAGAAFGSLVPLAAGWVLAYFSRERRGAALVAPGLAAAGGILWLWGRVEGRWGAPVPTGSAGMGAAIADTWPWTLRAAAIASALFLLWRARRRG